MLYRHYCRGKMNIGNAHTCPMPRYRGVVQQTLGLGTSANSGGRAFCGSGFIREEAGTSTQLQRLNHRIREQARLQQTHTIRGSVACPRRGRLRGLRDDRQLPDNPYYPPKPWPAERSHPDHRLQPHPAIGVCFRPFGFRSIAQDDDPAL
jgi:hypothetical protein